MNQLPFSKQETQQTTLVSTALKPTQEKHTLNTLFKQSPPACKFVRRADDQFKPLPLLANLSAPPASYFQLPKTFLLLLHFLEKTTSLHFPAPIPITVFSFFLFFSSLIQKSHLCRSPSLPPSKSPLHAMAPNILPLHERIDVGVLDSRQVESANKSLRKTTVDLRATSHRLLGMAIGVAIGSETPFVWFV